MIVTYDCKSCIIDTMIQSQGETTGFYSGTVY